MKKEVWDGALSSCNSQFFVAKFRGEVFTYFYTIALKYHSSMLYAVVRSAKTIFL
jgi:hypothetical protein